MRTNYFKSLIIIILVGSMMTSHTMAQHHHNEKPISFKQNLKPFNEVFLITLPSFDLEKMLKEDSIWRAKGLKFLRFAKTIDVNINVKERGIKETLSDGTKIWRLGIKSKGAHSLNVILKSIQWYKMHNYLHTAKIRNT